MGIQERDMSKEKTPFNIVLVVLVVFAIFGLYWLSRLGLDAGTSYLWLIFIGLVFILVVFAAKLAGVSFWFEVPIDKNNERSILMLIVGILSLFLLLGIAKVTGLNIYNPAVTAPLASFGVGFGEQTFAAISAATSPFWIFFIIVFSAAVIEEIILGYAFPAMGSLLGYGIRKMFKLDFGDDGGEHSGNYISDFVWSMFFSVVAFGMLHFFNKTYVDPTTGKMILSMLIWAMSFRLLLNIFIYKFGNFGLSWSIGVHAVNNALYLGGATVGAALVTWPGGYLIDAILVVFIFFAAISIKKMIQEGISASKDFITFD